MSAALLTEVPRIDRCDGCRFWRRSHEATGRGTRHGQCRSDPPRLIETLLEPSQDGEPVDLRAATRFPVTGEDDWCGRFERKEARA